MIFSTHGKKAILYKAVRKNDDGILHADYNSSFKYTVGEVARNLGFLPTNCDKYVSFFLDTLRNTPHYCGHYHVDRIINKQSRILFDDIIELPSNLDF